MNPYFHNQLIFDHLIFDASLQTQYQQCFRPQTYYYPFQQIPQNFIPYSYYQPNQLIPQQQLNQIYQEKEQDEGLGVQNTTRLIAHCQSSKSSSEQENNSTLDKDTLRKYILLVIDEDDTINQLISNLQEQNKLNLSKALEVLEKKQKQQSKSREELIKFCLRKAFRYIFRCIQKQQDQSKTNLKIARQLFQSSIEEEKNKKIVLPFRKNSKNKTMNNDFLKEIFSSSIFLNYYKEFLGIYDVYADHLEDELENDRNHKIQKLLDKIWESLKHTKQPLIDIKRLPWSTKNTERVKQLAHELLAFSQHS